MDAMDAMDATAMDAMDAMRAIAMDAMDAMHVVAMDALWPPACNVNSPKPQACEGNSAKATGMPWEFVTVRGRHERLAEQMLWTLCALWMLWALCVLWTSW